MGRRKEFDKSFDAHAVQVRTSRTPMIVSFKSFAFH